MAESKQRTRPPPNRRRDKVQLSCDQCRHRKLKCDRVKPCGACLRRGLSDTCNYAAVQPPAAPPSTSNLHSRISELEALVMTFMQGQAPSYTHFSPEICPPDDARIESVSPTDPGTLKQRDCGVSYIQSVHWEAILTQVRGLKEDMVVESKPMSGSHFFYGPQRHASRDEILAAVPARPLVDRLMALHFDSYMVTPYLLHRKKFLREYEAFWENPASTSVAWLGLMFSMLFIAVQLQCFAIDVQDRDVDSLRAQYLAMKDDFREKAMQCLVLARYTKGGPYILETLITILIGEFVLSKDSDTDGWLLISTIFHLAVRMGYHRDPDHFPSISTFEGEMRRRIWTTILSLDVALSLEMGLPRNATGPHIDTKEPRNLRDCDFNEDATEIPPPRPETEWTPVLALIARARLISVLGTICDINTDINPPSHDQIFQADALLEDVHKRAIPSILRWGTVSHPITDSPNLVVQRVSIETAYHKSRILLYRRALIPTDLASKPHQRDNNAVQICLEAALKILSFQEMLHEESQPFGRLCQLRWKTTHIFNQDVLLATSVLCLYLQDADKFEGPSTSVSGQRVSADEIRQRLTVSHRIWLQMSPTSAEAGKVARALSIVLGIPEACADELSGVADYDFLADSDAAPPMSEDGLFDYHHPGFYDPLTFFDNVLETRGM